MRRPSQGTGKTSKPATIVFAAAFATMAAGFLAYQVGLAASPPATPLAVPPPGLQLPVVGSTVSAPPKTRRLLVLPSCDSCTLRALPPDVVKLSASDPETLILEPEGHPRKELLAARARVLTGDKALSLGAWASDGPVVLSLGDGARVVAVETDPARIAAVIERELGERTPASNPREEER
ncbi:MAG: hypothetical protein IT207_06690 [Fimbriimonadaceae bacterium]|nr:hypothetical protein [Fimbriimonadaceae bacterium]